MTKPTGAKVFKEFGVPTSFVIRHFPLFNFHRMPTLSPCLSFN